MGGYWINCPTCGGSGFVESPEARIKREEAERARQEAHRRWEAQAESLLRDANTLYVRGEFREADRAYTKLLANYEDSAAAREALRILEERSQLKEAQERAKENARRLNEKVAILNARLQTDKGKKLELKPSVGNLSPRDTIFGKRRETAEGIPIKQSIRLGKGDLEISDYAFENVRIACHLMEKAKSKKDQEEATYIWDQAERAINGGKIEVVVPPPPETPTATKRTEEYKKLASDVAIAQARSEYYAREREVVEERLKELRESKKKLQARLPTPEPKPQQHPLPAEVAPPKDRIPPKAVTPPKNDEEKPKGNLLPEMEKFEKDQAELAAKLAKLTDKQTAAEQSKNENETQLKKFIKENPELAPRKKKE